MTVAICIACGEAKRGAWTACKDCGFRPELGWEMAVSLVCSDQLLPPQQLASLGANIIADILRGERHEWRFDEGADIYITRLFEDPSYRDMFILHRESKRGWLSKELDFHYSDEGGYRHQVVRRGEDISKRQFDDLAKSKGSDDFLISDRDADLNPSITSKDIWYCCLDLNTYAGRFGEDLSVAVRNLNEEAARFTVSYLQRKHGIDMSPLLTME
jgi:hypothetical protein